MTRGWRVWRRGWSVSVVGLRHNDGFADVSFCMVSDQVITCAGACPSGPIITATTPPSWRYRYYLSEEATTVDHRRMSVRGRVLAPVLMMWPLLYWCGKPRVLPPGKGTYQLLGPVCRTAAHPTRHVIDASSRFSRRSRLLPLFTNLALAVPKDARYAAAPDEQPRRAARKP